VAQGVRQNDGPSGLRAGLRIADWSLRLKMAVLLVVASLFPLGIEAFRAIRQSRQQLLATTGALLSARGDQLVGEIDTFNRGLMRSAEHLARLPGIVAFCGATGEDVGRYARAAMDVWPSTDAKIRGVALLDRSGVVTLSTETPLVGMKPALGIVVQRALQGHAVMSDVFVAGREVGYAPTIAYLVPVRGRSGAVLGLVALWVRALALWDMARTSNGLAGPESFAVLFDQQGIRIAHTYSDGIVFHPGGALDGSVVEALVAEGRFGPKTRELLQDVRAFPEQFERARSSSPEGGLFRGFAPVNSKWNYGVARRLQTVPWTLFYMIPEQGLNAQIAAATRKTVFFAAAIMFGALLAGSLFAGVILKPVRALSTATEALAHGDLTARVSIGPRGDELGGLGRDFNAMAGRLEGQAKSLEQARDDLALKVQEAEGATRELEAFSYSVAHDLRAPLRGMNGFAQVLLDSYRDKLDAQGQDWLAEIVLNAKKMGELIDGLLSLARVTRSELKTERVDLTSVAREAVAQLAASDPHRSVTVHLQEGLRADADPRLVRALLDNLLGNAWKFTGKATSARIELGAGDKDGKVAFFVRDNGAGFDMAFADKLFAPFQRLHTAVEFSGTGIGLATAQRIVHRHGGRISAEGTVDVGATFYFTFPVRASGAKT
jgi:signal transduction histidine kinase